MRRENALLELTLLDAEASSAKFEDVAIDALNRGIPAEIVTRLKELWEATRVLAGHTVSIGKIVVSKIMEFIGSHPEIAVGAALGAAVAFLATSAVPLIGTLLAPLAALIGAIYGAGVGASQAQGHLEKSIGGSLLALVRSWFDLLIEIMSAASEYIQDQRQQ